MSVCKREWQRAYDEIKDMEAQWSEHGIAIAKFWLQIDKDEQLRRFNDRQNDPNKQWKITDEDWRNRDKWDAYEAAVNEMLVRTDTSYAPWTVVEGNNKYYARLKVLKTVIDLLRHRQKNSSKIQEISTILRTIFFLIHYRYSERKCFVLDNQKLY